MGFQTNPFSPQLRNIFGQQPAAAPNFAMPRPDFGPVAGPPLPQQQQSPMSAGGMLDWNDLAPTPALEAYKSHLEEYPQYQAPGKLSRLAAAMGGFAGGWQQGPAAGVATAKGILDMPFQQRYTDWASKGYGLKEAADIESKQAGSRVKWAQDQRQYELDWAKQRLADAKTQAEIDNIRDQMKVRGIKDDVDAQGNRVLYDLKNPNSPPVPLFQTNAETPIERQGARQFGRETQQQLANTNNLAANQRLGSRIGADVKLQGMRDTSAAAARTSAEGIARMPARSAAAPMEPSATEQQTAQQMSLRNILQKGFVKARNGDQLDITAEDLKKLIDPTTGRLKPRPAIYGTGWGGTDPDLLELYDVIVEEMNKGAGPIAGRR